MKRYNIKVNQPLPTDSEIEDAKNFNALLSDFGELHQPQKMATKRHKNQRMVRILVVIVAIGLALMASFGVFDQQETTKSPTEKNLPKK